MNKKILIGSIFAALLMVSMPFVSTLQARLAPATSEVIREESVNEKEDVIVEENINIKNLLFQTIADIYNNPELNELFDVSSESVTVEDLESLYQIGLKFYKQLDNDALNNFVNSFYTTNTQLKELKGEINNIIMNDETIKSNIEMLKQMNDDCDCNSEDNPLPWFPGKIIICSILYALALGYIVLAFIPVAVFTALAWIFRARADLAETFLALAGACMVPMGLTIGVLLFSFGCL